MPFNRNGRSPSAGSSWLGCPAVALKYQAAVSRSVAPDAEPFITRILRVVVPRHHDRVRADEVIAPEEGGTALWLFKEQPAHRGDLVGAPQLVRVDLPEEARHVEIVERRA